MLVGTIHMVRTSEPSIASGVKFLSAQGKATINSAKNTGKPRPLDVGVQQYNDFELKFSSTTI